MSENKRKKGLGRGLSALLDDIGAAAAINEPTQPSPSEGQAPRSAPIDLIRPNPNQPRRTFPPSEMKDLVASIREKGVLQPLLVRPDPETSGGWMIVAGERRWRAAQEAELHELPIIARDLSDEETLEIGIIENVQRADLNAIEEAEGYQQLIDAFGHSQGDVARIIGKSRPYIANALRLLSLPSYVRDLLTEGKLTAGHARALVTATDPAALARKIVNEGLTVREAEALARTVANKRAPAPRPSGKDADTRSLEADLSAALDGVRVTIDHKGEKGGKLVLDYRSLEELDSLCQLLMR